MPKTGWGWGGRKLVVFGSLLIFILVLSLCYLVRMHHHLVEIPSNYKHMIPISRWIQETDYQINLLYFHFM